MKSIFVSYKYEDLAKKNKLKRWEERGDLGEVRITGETKDVRQGGREAVEAHLKPKIEGMAAMLVLVGDDSHNSQWMDWEIDVAQQYNKKVLPVRIPGTTGAAPAAIRHLRTIEFNPNMIVKYV